MEPFVGLMRRYCIDYTSAHDQTVCDEIMAEDYTVTISGRTMEMPAYREAVAAAFRRFPTLTLTVHDMILSGDRLAMRFSEHGATKGDPARVAVWPGISLYRWDGARLRWCRVEQDFQGRDEQGAAGRPAPLEPAHPDPWATTADRPANPEGEALLRDWLELLRADPAAALARDGVRLLEEHPGAPPPLLGAGQLTVDDLFSAGDRLAAAITLRGRYLGGLPGVAPAHGRPAGTRSPDAAGADRTPAEISATLLARVAGGRLVELVMVRDRWGLARRLRA